VALDLRVLGFALASTALSALAFGLAPAIRGAATDAAAALKEGTSRASTGKPRGRLSQLLVVAEVALAVCLVTGAGLLFRSFLAVRGVDLGFEVEDRWAATVVLPPRYDTDAELLSLVDDVTTGLSRLPGVRAVTYTSRLPLSGTGVLASSLIVEGSAVDAGAAPIGGRAVAANYFRVVGVPLLQGRGFSSADRAGAEPVVIINQEMMRQVFANEDPIGRRVTWGYAGSRATTWYGVVGVVGDERQHGPREAPQMEAFLSFRQLPAARPKFVIHASGGTAVRADAVRAAIARVDPLLPLFEFQSLTDLYAAALGRDRFLLLLIGAFGALALVLGTVGVYGVTAEAVARRSKEMGIRIALGASPRDIARVIVGQGFGLAASGIAIGLVGALAGSRVLVSVLYGVPPRDTVTLLGVATVLIIASLTACAIPARRATRVDPIIALRQE
jgi:putative ABC transport system permease protein